MQKKKPPAPKVKRSRTRLGCFTCRDRHMKCDEQLPVCQNCINSKRKCYRGIRLNFTQYTIYDPREAGQAAPEPYAPPQPFRILDQSITVSQMYSNGAERYRPYLHLHSPTDLQDADRLLLHDLSSAALLAPPDVPDPPPLAYQQGQMPLSHVLLVAAVEPVPLAPYAIDPAPSMLEGDLWALPLAGNNMYSILDNVILENYDIKSVLMHQMGQAADHMDAEGEFAPLYGPFVTFPMAESNAFQYRKQSWPVPAEFKSEFETPALAAQPFIALLQSQKYYWLLDLFNDLNFWKAVVPNYCARLAQTDDDAWKPRSRFLLDCLLACDELSSLDAVLACAREQLSEWSEFGSKDVTATTFRAFERVLVLVVLILLAVLLHLVRPGFTVDNTCIMILANQGLLCHKLVARYQRILEAKFKRMTSAVLTVASFQAIVILRYFIRAQLRSRFPDTLLGNHSQALANPLEADVVYDELHEYSLGDLFTLSAFEQHHVDNGFAGFDITPADRTAVSDAARLRQCFWGLVKLENLLQHQRTQQPGAEWTSSSATPGTVLIPNDKCTALNLLGAYVHKLQVQPNSGRGPDPTKRLQDIFSKINSSTMAQDIKEKWGTMFGWTMEL